MLTNLQLMEQGWLWLNIGSVWQSLGKYGLTKPLINAENSFFADCCEVSAIFLVCMRLFLKKFLVKKDSILFKGCLTVRIEQYFLSLSNASFSEQLAITPSPARWYLKWNRKKIKTQFHSQSKRLYIANGKYKSIYYVHLLQEF